MIYPVPDSVALADLEEELRLRVGPVTSLRVADGAADILFERVQGLAPLNFCKHVQRLG